MQLWPQGWQGGMRLKNYFKRSHVKMHFFCLLLHKTPIQHEQVMKKEPKTWFYSFSACLSALSAQTRIFENAAYGFFERYHGPLNACKKLEKSNEPFLRKVWKTLFLGKLGPFWAHLSPQGGLRIFFQKSKNVIFLLLWLLTIMQKIRKNQWADPEKNWLQTHARTDGRTGLNL